MSFIIREYVESDFAAVARYIELLVSHLVSIDRWDSVFVPNEGYGERYAKELLRQVGPEGKVLVAVEGEVVGVIMGSIERNEEAVSNDKLQIWGRVLALNIDESERGKGVGSKLLATMEEYFREKKCEAVMIEIFAPNTPAFQFYEKNGYEEFTQNLIKKLS